MKTSVPGEGMRCFFLTLGSLETLAEPVLAKGREKDFSGEE